MPKEQIVAGNRLHEYLRDRVRSGLFSQNLQLTENTEFYIVNLLIDFERTEHLFTMEHDHLEEEPLAMMLARALDGDTPTQVRELKHLGDVALYTVSFFAEHIKEGPVSVDYYIDMGSSAYDTLSNQLLCEHVFSEIYKELSDNFSGVAGALDGLHVAEGANSNMELLYLYERWLKTGDERVRQLLVKEGIVPLKKKIVDS